MMNNSAWNWNSEKRQIADIGKVKTSYEEVHEWVASPDGERIAVPVMIERPDTVGICINGATVEKEFERAWQLKYGPDGRLAALVRMDDEWTVAVDGVPWEETFDFAWDIKFSDNGEKIAVQVKQDPKYAIAVNGEAWETGFLSIRDYVLSADGSKVAATVQVEQLAEGDIFKFMEGTWSVAVDGAAWDEKFINVYAPRISADNGRVAVEIRTDIQEYTACINGRSWDSKYGCIWEPSYRPDGKLILPVKTATGWTLAQDDELLWTKRYVQAWQQVVAPNGNGVAAVVAPGYGQWTVAVDDKPWKATFNDMVDKPVFSADSNHVAAAVKHDNRWGMAVDGRASRDTFDMVWDPVLAPDGSVVAAKVEKNGKYAVAVNGKTIGQGCEAIWNPTFSSDGKKLLIRAIEDLSLIHI